MFTTTARTNNHTWLGLALLSGAVVTVSLGAVHSPFVIAGAVLGAALLAIALMAPLALVAFMLVTGPLDLSFMTGGFKSLLPHLGGLDMNGIRLVGATAGFVAYIMFEPRSRAAAVGPLGRTWVVFLAFAATTLGFSLDRLEGMRLLFKLAYPFLTFLIVIGVAATRERAFMLMKWTLGAAALYTLVINPILVANGGYYVDYQGVLRVGGMGSAPAPFAYYLLAILMMVFARFTVRMQTSYLWFGLVLLVWIGLTGARIAALAAVVGVGTIGVLAAKSSGNRKILVGALVAVGLSAVVAVPTVLARTFGFVPTPGELFQLVRSPVALYNSINWGGRQLLWALLWAAFMGSPIFGLGLGSTVAVIRESFRGGAIHNAHNDYMRLATDTGLLGLLLFLAAIGTWLVAAVRFSRSNDSAVREFAFASVGTGLAFLVVAITDNANDYYTHLSQYLGFFLACAVIAHNDPQSRTTDS